MASKDLPIFPRFSSTIIYSDVGVQADEQVCISWGKRQLQCRPVHRSRPAHTQSMVQLPEVHPRTVRPTERSLRAQNPDAKSRGTHDNAVRLRHVEPARLLLRHAAPSPPQVFDSLHRLAKNSMFVRLGTDYEIRNGGYFESIKNSANQFISKP